MSWLSDLANKAKNVGSRTFDQVNPFDNGLSATTRQINPNVAPQSFAQQALRLPVNIISNATPQGYAISNAAPAIGRTLSSFTKAIPQIPSDSPLRFANNLAINPYKTTMGHTGTALQGHNPYTGSIKQQLGQGLQDALNVSTVIPAGEGVGLLAEKAPLLTKIGQGAKLGAKSGAIFNAAQGVSTGLKDNSSVTNILKQLPVNTAVGAVSGAALGVAGPVIGKGTSLAVTGASKALKQLPENVAKVDEKLFTPRTTVNDQYTLQDLSNHLSGAKTLSPKEYSDTMVKSRDIAQKHGVDIINGSPNDRLNSVNSILDNIHKENRFFNSDGSVGLGRAAPNPSESPPQIPTGKQKGSLPLSQSTPPADVVANVKGTSLASGASKVLPQIPTQSQIATNLTKLKTEPKLSAGTERALLPEQTSLGNNTPFSTKAYIDEQSALQKNASKGSSLGSRLRSEFAIKGLDALSPIEKPVEKALGGREANYALRDKLDRSLRSDTIAGQYAKDNGLHEIIKNAPDTKALDQYLIAKHSAELEANGVKTGRNAAKDAELVKQLAPTYEAHAQGISDYSNKLLDKTVDYGLISRDTAGYLKQKYPNYVPFDRIFSDAEMQGAKGSGSGPASLSTQTVIQRIKGSERQIHSPLESMLAKTHDVVAQGERNLAAKAVTETRTLPGNPLSLKELKLGESIGNRPSVSYIENGVKRTFETTPEVAAAAKNLNKQQLGLIGKVLSYPTRMLRLGATGVNVGFTMANVVKDVASGAINSRHPVESLANPRVFLDALKAATRHGGASYGELVREGAGGTSFDISRNAAKDTVGKIRSERNIGTKAFYTVRHPGELLRAVEDTIGRSEEFGRASQYYGNKNAALKKGLPLDQAKAYGADAARNNTVNFARAGEYGRVLNSVLPYFNAGIQGSRTLMRNVKERPIQTGAKIAITAFMPVAATTAWNLNDPKRKQAYDDISDYEKQGNLIIVPPNPKKDASGRWNVIKIPVSQEVANLNNIVRNGVEALHKDKGMDFPSLVGNLTGTATSLNVQSPRQAAGQVIPQALKPGIETLTNQNLFTGNPVVPQSKQMLDKKDQYGNNTSGTAKAIGQATNLSPYAIDNALKTATGGAGQNSLNVSDRLLSAFKLIKPDEVKGKTLQASILNRFTSAQGSSEYAAIDKNIEQKSQQLKSSPEYKSLSPEDKAKALNRLKNHVVASTKNEVDAKLGKGQFAADFAGKQKNLSKRQAGLLTGSTDVNSYLKAASATSKPLPQGMNGYDVQTLEKFSGKTPEEKKQIFAKEKDSEYKLKLAEFEKSKHAGSLTDVQNIKGQHELAKAKVGASYDKSVRDLYTLGKAQIDSYLKTQPNGGTLAKQLIEYDNQLKEAGVSERTKFTDKYGNTSIAPTGRVARSGGGRGRRGGSRGGRVASGKRQLPQFHSKPMAFHSFKTKSFSAPKLRKRAFA